MPEVILPGTYISVRDEGLVTAGRIATGYIGVVGSAEKGPINEAVILGSLSEARERFGEAGPWRGGGKSELTLVRAIELMFNNGASTVYAVRAARKGARPAFFPITKASHQLITFKAQSPGSPGNGIQIKISDVKDAPALGTKLLQISRVVETFTGTSARDLADQVNAGSTLLQAELDAAAGTEAPDNLDAPIAGGAPGAATALLTLKKADASVMTLRPRVALGGSGKALQIKISDATGKEKGKKILQLAQTETFTGTSATSLAAEVNSTSALVRADLNESQAEETPPALEGTLADGDDGEAAFDYKGALEVLENEIVNIVVLAGQNAGMATELDAHLKRTAQIQRERIGIIGSDGSTDPAAIAKVTDGIASERLIFVAPGIRAKVVDPATREEREISLPGAYTAAAVAGLVSSLPVHVSPTNKTLTLGGLSSAFTSSQLEKLVQSRVLAVEKREGYRVVKGITTATNSAWHQITTRRIVDYALYGVRSACNPYVGKLNNDRVRSAMKATLDGFLTRMVQDEALVGYQLEVSATRAQEIAGECQVVMTIQPTFSIDFIQVTMYLS